MIHFYELLCYELLCYELLCSLQTYKLMNWFESQNIVFLAYLSRRKGSTKGVSSDEKGREAKGTVMMIFFPPSGNITRGPIKHIFAPFETQIAKKLSTS